DDLLDPLVNLDPGRFVLLANTILQELVDFLVGVLEEVVGAAGTKRVTSIGVTVAATIDPVEEPGVVFANWQTREDVRGDAFLQLDLDPDIAPPLLGDLRFGPALGVTL